MKSFKNTFSDTNRDTMADDLISIFHKSKCSSGFISHLYHHELKHLYSEATVPRAVQYRISPTSYLELPSGEEPATTLCQDLYTKLDTLLQSILYSKPHFVLCIKPNETQDVQFDHQFVVTQCRALRILETCHVMADGLPHRMKIATFYARYRVVGSDSDGMNCDVDMVMKCQRLIDEMKERWTKNGSSRLAYMECVIGTSHVAFSEGARQMMERMRNYSRENAALMIQRWWRRKRQDVTKSCDFNVILQTLSLNGLNKVILYKPVYQEIL